jgi:drug/metabolite transporter (DMT)-like permease
MPGQSSLFLPRLAMLSACAIWGLAFVVVHRGLRDLPVFHLLALRFALGSALLLPLVLARARRAGRRYRPNLASVAVGLALLAGFALQTYGLLWTTPSRSAFLTGLSVLLVPLLAWITRTEQPRPGPVLGALCAAAGLWVLYRPNAGTQPFGVGDGLTILGAVVFAGHLLLIDRAVRTTSSSELALTQFLVVMLLAAPSFAIQPPSAAEFTPLAWFTIAITGVFATAVAFLCQVYAQRRLGVLESAVILTLEPVFAALASVALGIEPYSAALLVGGTLILVAMVLAQIGAPPAKV